jgi:hypothetical protein
MTTNGSAPNPATPTETPFDALAGQLQQYMMFGCLAGEGETSKLSPAAIDARLIASLCTITGCPDGNIPASALPALMYAIWEYKHRELHEMAELYEGDKEYLRAQIAGLN